MRHCRWRVVHHRRRAAACRGLDRRQNPPSVRADRQAIPGSLRHLFDWLVTGQIVPVNPASSVRGLSHMVKTGKTPILDAEEARRLLASIDTNNHAGLRDLALIALMVYFFARIDAALGMKVEDITAYLYVTACI
jgi:site-specific recombinase XerC